MDLILPYIQCRTATPKLGEALLLFSSFVSSCSTCWGAVGGGGIFFSFVKEKAETMQWVCMHVKCHVWMCRGHRFLSWHGQNGGPLLVVPWEIRGWLTMDSTTLFLLQPCISLSLSLKHCAGMLGTRTLEHGSSGRVHWALGNVGCKNRKPNVAVGCKNRKPNVAVFFFPHLPIWFLGQMKDRFCRTEWP